MSGRHTPRIISATGALRIAFGLRRLSACGAWRMMPFQKWSFDWLQGTPWEKMKVSIRFTTILVSVEYEYVHVSIKSIS